MKLAFCLFKYYPYGGLERDFLHIAKTCQARGHDIHVFTMDWDGEIPTGFHVTFIKPFGFTNAGRAKSFAKKLSRHLAKTPFDCVIGFNRLPGLDLYYAADACFAKEAQEKHPVLFKFLPRYKIYTHLEADVFSAQSKTKILLLNPAHLDDFKTHYQTLTRRFILLAPGVNEDRRRPVDQQARRKKLRGAADIREDEKIILMVGSDFERKGVDRALAAFNALPHVFREKTHLWIVGKGNATPYKKHEKITENTELEHVTFWGARDDIVDFYAAADCLLHPAVQETAGMVLIEALAAGLPTIVTQNCGYAAYIQKAHAGIVIPEPFEQSRLNRALETILDNERTLADYRQNALNFGKTHDLFQLSKQITDVIEQWKKT